MTIAQIKEAKPETVELLADDILRLQLLNVQAYSGALNPSDIYRTLVMGTPLVFPYYREIEEKDTAICSSLSMRRLLVMARDSGIVSADQTKGEAQKYADACDSFLKSIPRLDFAMWELLDAPAYGFSCVEIMWQIGGKQPGIWVEKLIGRPQEFFRFGKLYMPQVRDLVLSQVPGGEGQPVPQTKFLVATYQPRHGDRRGIPILRRLFWPSWFKRNALRLHLHFLERGGGTTVVQYPSGSAKSEKDKALDAAMAIATEIAVAVPETLKLYDAALRSTRVMDAADFRSMVDYFDSEMTRIILGQTLTTHGAEQSRGSMALGEIHEEMMYEIIRNDGADLEDVINEQLLAPWLLWTFGPRALEEEVRPYWRIEKDPPKDAASAIDLLAKVRAMVKVKQADVYAAAQIEMPDKTDLVVDPPAMPTSLFRPGE